MTADTLRQCEFQANMTYLSAIDTHFQAMAPYPIISDFNEK